MRALFLTEEQVDGCSVQVPVLAYLVLKVALVGVSNPLRQVAEEDERGHIGALEHGDVLDFDIFPLDGRRRECRDVGLQRVVQLRCGDGRAAVVVHLDGRLQHLVDALLGERRPEDDGEVGERGEALADSSLEVVKSTL